MTPADALRRNCFEQRDYIEHLPLKELHRMLQGHFAYIDEVWEHEGVSACYDWSKTLLPNGPHLTDTTQLRDLPLRWLIVFPHVGGNEGHYVHVDVVLRVGIGVEEVRVPLFLIKTFSGQDMAIKIAGELCRVLGV